jgi:phospholipid/cholesterol/gamma-HCH transport system substrate-binding protein
MRTRMIELAVGLFMVAGIAALFFLAIKVSGLADEASKPSYRVYASFQNASGLTVRGKVTMAGVVIGRVASIQLDPQTFKAKVGLDIYKTANNISIDAVASILTAGLLGEKYVGIVQGAEEEFLKEGSVIDQTQSSLVLEELIGKFLFNKANEAAKTQP